MKTPESATDNNVGSKMFENVPETNVGKINGRTPDEIKKGLNCNNIDHCNDCPYDGMDCAKHVDQDALAYIQQLEGDLVEERELNEFLCDKVKQLESRLAQVERERDAAVNDIEPKCDYCAFEHNLYGEAPCPTEEELETDAYCFGFKWRGVCPENTKDGADV